MAQASVYILNKGLNQPLEFLGLRAQYIWYLGGCVLGCLALFVVLYVIGLPSFICVVFAFVSGGGGIIFVYNLNDKYGQHGLMKLYAKKSMPNSINIDSRSVFIHLTDVE